MLSILTAALLPVLVLVAFILRKDRNRPEPAGQLLKAFGLGVLSVIPALLLAGFFGSLGLVPDPVENEWQAVLTSFCGAAIPEEAAKLFMLWLVLRKNPFFDEKMDGIVYAACVSLGFAATENLFYLFGDAENYLEIGISRAIFAVPGHFCDGVLMGYYYSLARFGTRGRRRHAILIYLAPMLAHGVYDSLLFAAGVGASYSWVLYLFFPIFCYWLWRFATRRITAHLAADLALPPLPPSPALTPLPPIPPLPPLPPRPGTD